MVCCRPGTSYLGRCTRNKITEASALRQNFARGFDSPLCLLIYSWSETRKVLQPIWFIYLPTLGRRFFFRVQRDEKFLQEGIWLKGLKVDAAFPPSQKAFIKFLLPTFPSHNSSVEKSILLMLMSQWPLSPLSFASAQAKRFLDLSFISSVFSPLESPAHCV